MMDEGKLREAVDGKWVNIYASNYAQVKEQLQDQEGQRGWIGAMAQRVSGSESRSGKAYLAARRSIERVEKGQFKESRRYSPEMARVGRTLPPIGKKLPDNQITITVNGEHADGRTRSFTARFKGADAYAFANNPGYAAFFYQYNPEYLKKGGAYDQFNGDDSGALTVTAVS